MSFRPEIQHSVWPTPDEDENAHKTDGNSQNQTVTCWPFVLGFIIAIIIGSIPLATVLVYWLKKSQ
jgi:heme/copper-type cytochrome/quinol oxidase subunit 4